LTRRPHILFVDDETRILGGLRRMLRAHRDRWDMAFAESGEDALAIMRSTPCDVIVSDYRMPGMDGVELLQHVRDDYPGTARVILSGQTNEDSLLKSFVLAHVFLNKPSGEDEIVETIERLIEVRETAADEEVRRDVAFIESLPSPPNTLYEMIEALDSEDASARSVAEVVEKDPAAAAKVLHLVNSSAYALGRHVGNIAQAVALLGLNTVRGLVLMHDLIRTFDAVGSVPAEWIERTTVHSVETSRLARQFAAGTPWEHDAFTAGLLHDVGQLVLASSRPVAWAEVIETWQRDDGSLSAAELAAFGVSHIDIGTHLLGLWGLPDQVIEAVSGHATTERLTAVTDISTAVALARAVVEAELGPVCGGSDILGALDEQELAAPVQGSINRWRRERTTLKR
jgi:HD-like signal output (HDOD) protein